MSSSNPKSKKFHLGCILYVLIAVVIAVIVFWYPINKAYNTREVTVTVTDRGVKTGNSSSKYLVYTLDENGDPQVFEITDCLLRLRFNSSDVYAVIEEGKTYTFTVGGIRNTWLSWYPNIYEYEEVIADD